MNSLSHLTEYQASGVDYSILDNVKREAMARAAATRHLLEQHGGREVAESRGATAYVFELGEQTLAIVIEGLGTKGLIAEEWLKRTGESRFRDVAIDAVAAIANDVISVGANPVVICAYFATGSAEWYKDERRASDLLAGWQDACEACGATWGGGESPALPGLVHADQVELAGSAIGIVPKGRRPVFGDKTAPGDRIVLIRSSGLQTNGASLARRIASRLPEGLLAPLPSGRRFGDALLDPSVLYPRFVRALLASPIEPSFLNPITGHGLMKLMRSGLDVHYVIESVPPVPEVLQFMADQSGMDQASAYATLNMGIGYVAIVRERDANETIRIAAAEGYQAIDAGYVEQGARCLSVPALGIEYSTEDFSMKPSEEVRLRSEP